MNKIHRQTREKKAVEEGKGKGSKIVSVCAQRERRGLECIPDPTNRGPQT